MLMKNSTFIIISLLQCYHLDKILHFVLRSGQSILEDMKLCRIPTDYHTHLKLFHS